MVDVHDVAELVAELCSERLELDPRSRLVYKKPNGTRRILRLPGQGRSFGSSKFLEGAAYRSSIKNLPNSIQEAHQTQSPTALAEAGIAFVDSISALVCEPPCSEDLRAAVLARAENGAQQQQQLPASASQADQQQHLESCRAEFANIKQLLGGEVEQPQPAAAGTSAAAARKRPGEPLDPPGSHHSPKRVRGAAPGAAAAPGPGAGSSSGPQQGADCGSMQQHQPAQGLSEQHQQQAGDAAREARLQALEQKLLQQGLELQQVKRDWAALKQEVQEQSGTVTARLNGQDKLLRHVTGLLEKQQQTGEKQLEISQQTLDVIKQQQQQQQQQHAQQQQQQQVSAKPVASSGFQAGIGDVQAAAGRRSGLGEVLADVCRRVL